MNKFFLTFFFAILSIFTMVSALPTATVLSRDVYVPPVLYPHAGTVWKVGQRHNVTWDTSNPPKQITNPTGKIFLAKAGTLLDLADPLASGFSIMLGRFEITVPKVATGSDYSVVLFGDSGNYSPKFTIDA